jgi:hypothetical protein
MKLNMVGAISLVGVVISTPLWAGPVGVQKMSPDQQAVAVTELQAKKEQVSKFMLTPPLNKGPILIHNMDRVSKLNDLIDRLQTGQPVSPDEIDQQLQAPLR